MKLIKAKTETLKVSELKMLPFNRAIRMAQVDKLLSSIKKNGILRYPIIVKTKLFGNRLGHYVVDGQHFVTALHKASVNTVNCIVTESEKTHEIVEMMATLNNVVCTWKLEDYVAAYCSMSNDNYNSLRAHKLATGFNYSVSAKILGSSQISNIKNGTFKVHCTDQDKLTGYLVDICSLFETNNSKFMKAYITFFRATENYNHKHFMRGAAQRKKNLVIVHDEGAMTDLLHKIYSIK